MEESQGKGHKQFCSFYFVNGRTFQPEGLWQLLAGESVSS